MMLGWLFASPAERRLLSGGRLRGPTPWVIAIMSFSIMIIAASGLALTNTASLLSNAIQARYSIEVPGGGRDLQRLLQAVQSAPSAAAASRCRAGLADAVNRNTAGAFRITDMPCGTIAWSVT